MLWWSVIIRRIPVVYSVIFFYESTRMLLFNMLAVLAVDRIVANSEAVRRDLAARTWGLAEKTEVVYPGVDTSEFRPMAPGERNVLREELGVSPDTKLVGMFARFDPAKGHLTLLDAAAILLRKRKDVCFVVVGGVLSADAVSSHRSYHETVMRRWDDLGLAGAVRFLGHRDDAASLMRCCDVIAVPSIREGFGLTAVEAMASGVPVIASDSIGASELFNGNHAYTRISPLRSDLFASGIEHALCERSASEPPSASLPAWSAFAGALGKAYNNSISARVNK
jgi:glycosyltransferase involved in cell wall biosynthesis